MSERIKMSDTRVASVICCRGGLGELHREPSSAEVTAEVLAKQHFDIRLIVNHESEQVHSRSGARV
jgi:hypothetical protein